VRPTVCHVLLGLGIWDLAFARYNEVEHLERFEGRYNGLVDGVLAILCGTLAMRHALVQPRSQWVSYAYRTERNWRARPFVRGLGELNEVVRRAVLRHANSAQSGPHGGVTAASSAPSEAAAAAARPETAVASPAARVLEELAAARVRVELLDVWSLSYPRTGELPFGFDGLHWGCFQGRKFIRQVNSETRWPYEVAVAALQLSHGKLCCSDMARSYYARPRASAARWRWHACDRCALLHRPRGSCPRRMRSARARSRSEHTLTLESDRCEEHRAVEAEEPPSAQEHRAVGCAEGTLP
jgi:hypothetical protein